MKNGKYYVVLISFTSASQFHVRPTKSGHWNIGLSVLGHTHGVSQTWEQAVFGQPFGNPSNKIYSGANGEAITFGRYTLVLPPLQSHAYQQYTQQFQYV